jgi:hypothetical protein
MCCALRSVSLLITENLGVLVKDEFHFLLIASADLESATECRVTTGPTGVSLVFLCPHASSHMITNCQVPTPCFLM